MDESNKTTPPVTENAAPAKSDLAPAAAPNPQVMQPAAGGIEQSAKSSESKMMLWLIGGLVVIILVVGAIYFYSSSQQKASKAQPTPQPAAKVENLEKELDAVNLDDLDKEFTEVDSDLQSL